MHTNGVINKSSVRSSSVSPYLPALLILTAGTICLLFWNVFFTGIGTAVEPLAATPGRTGLAVYPNTATIDRTFSLTATSDMTAYLPIALNLRPTIAEVATSSGLPDAMVISLKYPDRWLHPQYSLDGGSTWQVVPTVPWAGAAVDHLRIAIAPRADRSVRLLVAVKAGERTGLYRTGDFGQSWSQVELSITDQNFDVLVASPADPTRLYLATRSNLSWPGPPWPPTYLGFARTSHDAGITWTSIGSEIDMSYSAIIPSPSLAARVYMYRTGYSFTWMQSDNAGGSWRLKWDFPFYLALDSQDPAQLYSIDGGRSDDGGVTWVPWTDLPCPLCQLLVHPAKSRVLLARCSQGLYRSIDAGDSWEQTSSLHGGWLAPDYGLPGRLLWAREDQLWVSCDDGGHWAPIATGCVLQGSAEEH